MTIKAYVYKETKEHIRKYRLLIIGILTLILAFSSPVVLYFLPKILADQTQSTMDLSSLFQTGQVPAIQSYIGDMYEIAGVLIIILSSGLILNEIKSHSIVIPFTNNLKMSQMIITKYMVYMFYISIIVLIGFIINHYYSGLVFKSFDASIIFTLNAYLAYMFIIGFHIALTFLISSYTKSLFATLSLTLLSYFVFPSLFNLLSLKIGTYQLLTSFQLLPLSKYTKLSMFVTFISIMILLYITTRKKVEI